MSPYRSPQLLVRVGVALFWCVTAATGAPVHAADDQPPPIAPPDATRQSAPAAAPSATSPAPVAAPEATPVKPEHDARIEEKHVGWRVSEVIVTPAGFTYHYTMTHLDNQDRGTSPLQPHTELSVPRFFRIDF